MIDHNGLIQLAPGVRIHVLDDENGFVETPTEVRRLQGARLCELAKQLLPGAPGNSAGTDAADEFTPLSTSAEVVRLLGALRTQGLLLENTRGASGGGSQTRTVSVLGPERLASQLIAVLERTDGLQSTYLGEPSETTELERALENTAAALTIVATASLFDPWAARVNEFCVRHNRGCLFYGTLPDDACHVGPLWSPQRVGACYECLRMRITSNSVHGPTWSAYMSCLGSSGARATPREVPAWMAARLAGAVGRRAISWLEHPGDDIADELAWFGADGTEAVRRHLLVVPTCPVCRDRDAAPTPARPDADLTHAEDERVGIVHSTGVRRAESGPPIYLSGSTSADFSLLKPPMRVTRNGGAGFSKKDAINATIGESLERYCAGIYRSEELRLAAWEQLAEPAINPSAFGFFSAEQYASTGFPFEPFEESTPVRWVQAMRLSDGETHWAPASQVYLYYRRAAGETAIGPSISTGLAAGPSLSQAVLSGLYEIMERDALAISWLHRMPPRPVSDGVLSASSQVSFHLERAASWRVRFYDLSLDLAPSVVVAVMDTRHGSEPIMSFGSACRWSPVHAVEKAFLEAAQGLTYVRRLLRQYQDWDAAEDYSDVDEFNKHAIIYSKYPELREKVDYLVHPTRPTPCTRPERTFYEAPKDVETTLGTIVEELDTAGYPVYVVDLTTPDVGQLGVRVVRVLVPGLQQLSGIHRYRMLGTPRLNKIAVALDVDSAPDNPYPHPLP